MAQGRFDPEMPPLLTVETQIGTFQKEISPLGLKWVWKGKMVRYVSVGALSGGGRGETLAARTPDTAPRDIHYLFCTGASVALVVEIMSMVVSACLSSLPLSRLPMLLPETLGSLLRGAHALG